MSKNNVGQTGPESLRLGGMSIDNLPIAEARITLDQLPLLNAADRETQVSNIKASYPKQDLPWITGALKECKGNLVNVRKLAKDSQSKIDEYMGLIGLCKHRDKLLATEQDESKIKAIKAQFPLYQVKAMKTQVGQFREAINKCDEVIDKEHASIELLNDLHRQCKERDDKLVTLTNLH